MVTIHKHIILFFSLLITVNAHTQAVIEAGKIEYERKTNLHKLNADNEWFARMKDQVAKFHISYFELTFNPEKSLFKPGKEIENKVGWFAPPAIANVVYTDLKTGFVTSSKAIFEQNVLVKDTLRNVRWKITNEFRDIAGFECRKAVGKIYDSVVVVAFYCEQILPSVGPENFNGLPGAILGLAIPRMWTTWFATKVEKANFGEAQPMEAPTKGKETNPKKMTEEMRTSLKDWGSYVNKMLWFVLL